MSAGRDTARSVGLFSRVRISVIKKVLSDLERWGVLNVVLLLDV